MVESDLSGGGGYERAGDASTSPAVLRTRHGRQRIDGQLHDDLPQPPASAARVRSPKTRKGGTAHCAPGTLRVLLVDDHRVIRRGISALIASRPDMMVVGEAVNGREAVDKARRLRPDVVVMDVSMPEMDGVEATRLIKTAQPEVRVVALSLYDSDPVVRSMLEAGAGAFVSKDASARELLEVICGGE